MSRQVRLIRKLVIRGVLVLVLVGIVAPFIHADGFHDRVQTALQNALHRRVQVGGVHFSLFNGPGFVMDHVLIDEDPAIGVEPLAYVESLDARIRLMSLFTGALEFSSLTLDSPSVNVVKPEGQSWNFVPLVQQATSNPAGGSNTRSGHEFPSIKIRGGRIDFKFGDTKSIFYLINANLDVSPRWREPGSFDVEFSAEPARTDRGAQGFGSFSGKGRWIHSASGEPKLDFSVELERSAMDDLARGFGDNDFGVHGIISSRASIKGPLSNLVVNGQMALADIHRWDFIPSGNTGTLQLNYRGTVNWPARMLEVAAPASDNPGKAVTARIRVFDFLTRPRWAAELAIDKLPAGGVLDASRHMGVPVPAEIKVDGNIGGVIGYSSAGGVQGSFALTHGVLHLSKQARLEMQDADLSVNGDQIRLAPVQVTGDDGQTAELAGEYSQARKELHVGIQGRSLRIAELQTGSGNMLASASVPFVENFSRGKWTGTLDYHFAGDGPGKWSGDIDLRDARVQVPGLAAPLTVSSASVEMDGERVAVTKLRARVGTVDLTGDYRYEPLQANPHRFNLSMPALDLGEAEQLLLPTLQRERGFLARTLRRTIPMPLWLQHRQAEGTVRIGTLTASALEFKDMRAHLVWDAGDVQLTNVSGRVEDAKATGQMGIDLTAEVPVYRIRGHVQDLSWKGGKVDFETKLTSRGTGTDFLLNLRSEGTFQARSVSVVPEAPLRSANGLYVFSITPLGPRIKLTACRRQWERSVFRARERRRTTESWKSRWRRIRV